MSNSEEVNQQPQLEAQLAQNKHEAYQTSPGEVAQTPQKLGLLARFKNLPPRKKRLVIVGIGLALSLCCLVSAIILLALTNQPQQELVEPNEVESTDSESFGRDVKTPFTFEMQDTTWLKLRTQQLTLAGYLNDKNVFTTVHELPYDATLVYLYDDESVSFVSDNLSELYLKEENLSASNFLTLEDGSKFTSTFFEPTERIVYYTYLDRQNIFHFSSRALAGTDGDYFSSAFLNANARLINFTPGTKTAYFEQSNVCYALVLKAKREDQKLEEDRCPLIKRNNLDRVFWDNSEPSGRYTNFQRGELYTTDFGELFRKVIGVGVPGSIFSTLTYKENSLYFVRSSLSATTPGVWTATQNALMRLDLSAVQPALLTDKVPEAKIKQVFTVKEGLFVIVEGEFGDEILKYNSVRRITPSYPSSFPASYPGSLYWDTLNLQGIVLEEASLLQADYTINDF